MHVNLWIVAACAVLGTIVADEKQYPFPQYGLCHDVHTFSEFQQSDYEGIWYLQYKTTGPTSHLHTCQATYEKKKSDRLDTFLYVYEDGVPLEAPVETPYEVSSTNNFFITVDTEKAGRFNVYYYILHADKESRVTYMCTDHELATRDKIALFIWTHDQSISEDKGQELIQKVKDNGWNVAFNKVEQAPDKCAVYSASNPLKAIADKGDL